MYEIAVMARSRQRRSAPDDRPPLRLTDRDDAILSSILRLRYCLVEHIQALHFPSYKTAAERLMRLYQHGFLDRIPLPAADGQPAMVHILAGGGVRRLSDRGARLPVEPRARATSPTGLEHELAVSTLLVELHKANAAATGAEFRCIERASAELSDRTAEGAEGLPIRPDGAAMLHAPGLASRLLLLEVDRGTMGPDRMERKFVAYRTWLSQTPERALTFLERLCERNGMPVPDAELDIKVLVVAPDAGRVQRLAALAVAAGCPRLVWLAEEDALLFHGALGAVWAPAGERISRSTHAVLRSILD